MKPVNLLLTRSRALRLLLVGLTLLALGLPAWARPRTALVLSGGGARGAAHVGVLKELERAQVPIDLIVGTSMGSLVGGLYASGLSPEQIEQRLLDIDWREVYSDRPLRKNVPFRRKQDDGVPLFDFEMGLGRNLKFQPSLVAGQKFGFSLQTWTMHTAGVEYFDDLPVPFRAVATDLHSGEAYVLDRGNLGTAIRASIAVPSVLAPVKIEGRVLVDGGLVSNLPIDVARALGAERVIAVDISTPLKDLPQLSLFSVASQSLSILSERALRDQRELLEPQDLLIAPVMEDVTATSFKVETLRHAIDQGGHAARAVSDALERFAVTPAAYGPFAERQRRDAASLVEDPMIDQTVVEGYSRVAPQRIMARIRSTAGTRLDLDRLREDLDRLYEIGEFQHVEFQLRREFDQTVLVIHVEEKPWGPNYIRFGLGLQSNVESRGSFGVLGQLTRTEVNPLGGEWKSRVSIGSNLELFSEFYQPLDWKGFPFVVPSIEYQRSEAFSTTAGGELNRLDFNLLVGAVDVGIQFRNFGELRVGAIRGTGRFDLIDGMNTGPVSFDIGGWRTSLSIDRLDNANFPRRGSVLNAGFLHATDALGSDQDYDLLEVFLLGAYTVGKNTVLAWVDGGSNLGSRLPFFEGQRLGGFLNLSGLDQGSLSGNVGGVVTTIYYRQIGLLTPTLGGGLYVGGSIESGGVWDRASDASSSELNWAGSLFVGADTKFGPLYLGYGRADNGDDALYLFLGRLF